MPAAVDVRTLWLLNFALGAWLLVRLSGRLRGIPFVYFRLYLAWSLLVSFVMAAVPALFPQEKNLYGWIFIFTSYASTIFEFLTILELSNLALEKFPAIRLASFRLLSLLWLILAISILSWFAYLSSAPAKKFPKLIAAIRYHDSVDVGFCLFILLFLGFIAWMPVPLSHNLLTHAFLLTGHFVLVALAYFLAQLEQFEADFKLSNYLSLGGTSILYALWALRLNPSESPVLATPRGELNLEEAQGMLARLAELNDTLSRSGPRILR
jgi:hypothetical protein